MVAGHHVPIEPLLYPSRHCHVTGAPVNINCPKVLLRNGADRLDRHGGSDRSDPACCEHGQPADCQRIHACRKGQIYVQKTTSFMA